MLVNGDDNLGVQQFTGGPNRWPHVEPQRSRSSAVASLVTENTACPERSERTLERDPSRPTPVAPGAEAEKRGQELGLEELWVELGRR
jgi:hypothetical protein